MFPASHAKKGRRLEVIKLKQVTLVLVDCRMKYPTRLYVLKVKTVTNTTGFKVDFYNILP